ncbi:hypothetical protein QJQ45_030338 [Haematococcus lacustris]|nr:hypothetical protein QJQ45_030338 [Haematococcus lacustris]
MSSWLKNWGKPSKEAYAGVEFWQSPDRCGWLTKQVMWPSRFHLHAPAQVNKCLSIKGAEDTINKAYAFEISTHTESMFFIAESEKVSLLEHDRGDYTTGS